MPKEKTVEKENFFFFFLKRKTAKYGFQKKVPSETYFFFPLVVFGFFGLQYLASSPAIMSSKAPCL